MSKHLIAFLMKILDLLLKSVDLINLDIFFVRLIITKKTVIRHCYEVRIKLRFTNEKAYIDSNSLFMMLIEAI